MYIKNYKETKQLLSVVETVEYKTEGSVARSYTTVHHSTVCSEALLTVPLQSSERTLYITLHDGYHLDFTAWVERGFLEPPSGNPFLLQETDHLYYIR